MEKHEECAYSKHFLGKIDYSVPARSYETPFLAEAQILL